MYREISSYRLDTMLLGPRKGTENGEEAERKRENKGKRKKNMEKLVGMVWCVFCCEI